MRVIRSPALCVKAVSLTCLTQKLVTRESTGLFRVYLPLEGVSLSTINAHVRPTGNVPNPLARRRSDEEDT